MPEMVNNSTMYAAIMTPWLVAYTFFLIILNVFGIVNF
jgi:hypothetical protein